MIVLHPDRWRGHALPCRPKQGLLDDTPRVQPLAVKKAAGREKKLVADLLSTRPMIP